MRILFIFPFALLCYFLEFNIPGTAFNFLMSVPNISIDKTFIADTIPPTVFCLTGINTLAIPSRGYVTIKAKDLDKGSFDNQTPLSKLKYYLNGDPAMDSICIACADLISFGNCHELKLDLTLWVEDEAGNKNSCTSTFLIQNKWDVCCCLDIWGNIEGAIRTPNGNDVTATISLTGDHNIDYVYSDNKIRFSLPKGKYTLCISRKNDYLNGVSTADIVKLQRHILGIEPFNSPYKMLAADVNVSNSLLATDITEIRRLVFGITTNFNKVPSWVFIPSNYTFPIDSFPDVKQFITSCIDFEVTSTSNTKFNFIAIKMGDVTYSANPE